MSEQHRFQRTAVNGDTVILSPLAWTSSTSGSSPAGYAWFVSLSGGYGYWFNRDHHGFVRAVRDQVQS